MGYIGSANFEEEWFALEKERMGTTDPSKAQALADRQAELEGKLVALAELAGADGVTRPVPDGGGCKSLGADNPRDIRIAIIGAGVSGLCMAARLRQEGFKNVVILEKAPQLGGTWYYNKYPGVACDVASYLYNFSFYKNPKWSAKFAPGDEIREYLEDFAGHFDLKSQIHFDCEVTKCLHRDNKWEISTKSGDTVYADVLIPAVGFLHVPFMPEFPGLESFKGIVRHTSRWSTDIGLEGKRIGIIGNGSSGVQFVSSSVDAVGSMTVFQRTSQWVFPGRNDYYSNLRQKMLGYYPTISHKLFEHFRSYYSDVLAGVRYKEGVEQAQPFLEACTAYLATVKDEALRKKLTPDYPIFCKRLVYSSGFYEAMQKEHVQLEQSPIASFEERGIRTSDGKLHELDIVVFATGFNSHLYCSTLNIEVEGGATLASEWESGAKSFKSVTLTGFPNMFMLGGPFTTVGNLSTMTSSELQANYIVDLIKKMNSSDVGIVSPKKEQQDQFLAEMRESMDHTIWLSGCKSWYINQQGLIDIWPKTPNAFFEMLTEGADLDEFEASAASLAKA